MLHRYNLRRNHQNPHDLAFERAITRFQNRNRTITQRGVGVVFVILCLSTQIDQLVRRIPYSWHLEGARFEYENLPPHQPEGTYGTLLAVPYDVTDFGIVVHSIRQILVIDDEPNFRLPWGKALVYLDHGRVTDVPPYRSRVWAYEWNYDLRNGRGDFEFLLDF